MAVAAAVSGSETSAEPPTRCGPYAASYSRFSSDLQSERSLTDQKRKCRERAAAEGFQLPPEYEFGDEATSGAKHSRQGLDAMLKAAEEGRIQLLILESLSRLARDSVLTMQTTRELVRCHGIRIISIDDGVDSNNSESWELLAAIHGIQNEQFLRSLAKFVHRGQEGIVLDRLCVGDYCFGYSSVAIPGSEASRAGRNAKPKKSYVVDPTEAGWVVRIFGWFVDEQRSMSWISRRLNECGAPKDHRSTTKHWTPVLVSKVLKSPKYVGRWPWGRRKNVRDPKTGRVRQEERSSRDTKKWDREFPELRIIDDQIFQKAQARLAELAGVHAGNRRANGQLAGASTQSSVSHPRHLLSGLIFCAKCQGRFHVGGRNAKYLFCAGYKSAACDCRTTLLRDLAEQMILKTISDRILNNEAWLELLSRFAQEEWEKLQKTLPNERRTLDNKLADVDQKISRLVDRCETSEDSDLELRLRERRAERSSVRQRLDEIGRTTDSDAHPPTQEWIKARLSELHTILASGGPAAARVLRELVGARIEVEEVRRPGRARHFLRGRVRLSLKHCVTLVSAHADSQALADHDEVLEIDFRRPARHELLAEEAKRLWDTGSNEREIAAALKCGRALVRRALKHWYTSRQLTPPDGRACRRRLARPRLAQTLAHEIMTLWHNDVLEGEIAKRLGCSIKIVRDAVVAWHAERNLPVPDGRTRRKQIRLRRGA